MVRLGDTWKDLEIYINCRLENLHNNRIKTVKITPIRRRGVAINHLTGRIRELKHLKSVVSGDIKSASKREWRELNKQTTKKAEQKW